MNDERLVSAGRQSGLTRLNSPRAFGATCFVVAVALVAFGGSAHVLYEATLIAIYGVVTVSQEWLIGRVGLISLGAAATMAVGAFATARLSETGWGVFPVPLLVSLVLGAIVGLLIGIPGLRFRGLYLMLTTLALQFIVSFAAERYQGVNNEAGFTVIPPHWKGLLLTNYRPLFLICAIVLGLCLLFLDGIYRGAPGRAWNAIRQSEPAASVLGVNLVRWKLAAFMGSSALTAVGGSLYAYQTGQVDYTSYSLDLSLVFVVMVFVGGVGTLVGPIIGAAAVVLLPELLQSASGSAGVSSWMVTNQAEVSNAIFGLLLLLALIYERGGLFAMLKRAFRLTTLCWGYIGRRLRAAGIEH